MTLNDLSMTVKPFQIFWIPETLGPKFYFDQHGLLCEENQTVRPKLTRDQLSSDAWSIVCTHPGVYTMVVNGNVNYRCTQCPQVMVPTHFKPATLDAAKPPDVVIKHYDDETANISRITNP